MAVSNNYEIKNYTLDGIATQFAIPFDVNVDDYGNAINIVVYLGLTELTKDVDYTISVKTINYPDAVSHTGEKLTVFRRTPIEQPVDFVDNGNFTLEDIETGLDRSIMIEQETAANLDNTITAQESAELAEQYKDIAITKASDAEDWAVGTRSDGETPSHSLESAKHYAESADTNASIATSMRNYALGFARESEGYAKGTQGGTPVDSSSPYYEANSKYYSEQAGTSATSASASATKASEWADKHEDSEVETGRYSAKHWAAKASTSAGGAAVSAYNAGQSETKAGKWAEEAEDVEVETGKYSAKHYAAKASASATSAESDAEDAEAWAVGQRGGTDVPATDPTYHNNSKWYNDNIAQQTVTPDNTCTLSNKTIAFSSNTMTDVASTNTSQTLTNKTISFDDNTLTGVQPTLTAGTGIDITGTTISAKQAYSTSEVFTGNYWIDGKPIYRKVYQGTLDSSKKYAVDISALNVEQFVNAWWCLNQGMGNVMLSSSYSSSTNFSRAHYKASDTSLYFEYGPAFAEGDKLTAVVEYTKTTD